MYKHTLIESVYIDIQIIPTHDMVNSIRFIAD